MSGCAYITCCDTHSAREFKCIIIYYPTISYETESKTTVYYNFLRHIYFAKRFMSFILS